MNTSSISSSYAYSGVQLNVAGVQQPKARDSDGDQDGSSSRVSREGGGHGMLGAVFQALGQMGLNQSATKPTTSQAASSSTSLSQTSGGGDVKQALHSFMHDLFQAMRGSDSSASSASGVSTPGNTASGKSYGDLASKFQELMQQLNSGGGSDALGKLKSSFDNLVKALGNGSTSGNPTVSGSSSATSNAPNLQDFLQKVSKNLQGGGISPVGSLVSTAA